MGNITGLTQLRFPVLQQALYVSGKLSGTLNIREMSCKQPQKSIVFFSLLIILFGCVSRKRNPYNESDYILAKVDSFNGRPGTEDYVYKYDTSRKMRIDYFGNGKLLLKYFTHNGKSDGKSEAYDYSGKLMAIDSFHDGTLIWSQKFTKPDTSIRVFRNGKIYAQDSSGNFRRVEN